MNGGNSNAFNPLSGKEIVYVLQAGGLVPVPVSALAGRYNSLIAQSGKSASLTGNTDVTPLASITIPANSLGPNGVLRVTSKWSWTSSTNVKNIFMLLSGSLVAISNNNAQPSLGYVAQWEINAANSLAQQVSASSYSTGGLADAYSTGFTTTNYDMSQPQTLQLSAQLGVSTETISLLAYSVECLNP